MRRKKSLLLKGFTLLEIIIVVIIIGVLASLAMPRYFKTVEYAKGQEALTSLSILRQAMNRCYLFDFQYTKCALTSLDVDDPGKLQGSHFSYSITSAATTFTISATRNTLEGGDGTSSISIDQDGHKSGGGVYSNIR